MPIPVDEDKAAQIMLTSCFPHPSKWPASDEEGATDEPFSVDEFLGHLQSPAASTSSQQSTGKRSLGEDTAFTPPPNSLAETAKHEFNKRVKLMARTRLFGDDSDEGEDRENPSIFNADKGEQQFLQEVSITPLRLSAGQRELKPEPSTSTLNRPLFQSPTPAILVKKARRRNSAPKEPATTETVL